MSVSAGETGDIVAAYQLGDGSSMPASDVTWVINNPAIATVTGGAGGHATVKGIAAGTTTLTVSGQGLTGTATVMVRAAVLTSIAITPPTPSVPVGISKQLTATGKYSDMSTADVTAMVEWKSSAETIATVDAAGLMNAVKVGTATITARIGAITGTTDASVTGAELVSIQVTPPNPDLPLGIKQQLTATGTFSDHTTQDLTSQVTWATDAEAHATVSGTGLVTAVAAGPANITATKGTISGSTRVNATPDPLDSIEIAPSEQRLARGLTLQLTATGRFHSGGTRDLSDQVEWASDAATVTVSATGLATAVDVGAATITAKLGAVTGSTTLTATDAVVQSIEVTPTAAGVVAGLTQQFIATGTFSDHTTQTITDQVTWTSSNEACAQISNADGSKGLASALVPGAATITATLDGVTGSTQLNVLTIDLEKIEVAPLSPSVALGRTLQFTATATFSNHTTLDLTTQVTWESAAPAVATISNAPGTQGSASTASVGSAVIRATLGRVTGSTTLTVTNAALEKIEVAPSNPSVALGRTQQFTATGTFSDHTIQTITDQVTWSSSSEDIAQISNAAGSNGLASTAGVGSASISATADGVTGSTTMTVTNAVLESIQLTPVTPSVAFGTVVPFVAIGTFSNHLTQDITTQVTWESSEPTVATISNADATKGVATTLIAGTTTITATLDDVSGSTVLTSTSAVLVGIEVAPIGASLPIGRKLRFTATGLYDDATTQDLTTQVLWASSNEAFAEISNTAGSQGQATALAAGQTTISATRGDITIATRLTVTRAVLDSIAVTAPATSIAKGRTVQFTATGTFSDRTTQDLTADVTWASSDTAVADVSNAAESHGRATANGVGTTTISATLDGVAGEASLTVNAAELESLAVAPVDPSVAAGQDRQFTATGTFSDHNEQDLTGQVFWASDHPDIAQISNAEGSKGLATSLVAGTTVISATLDGVTASSTLTVTDPLRASIAVTRPSRILRTGATQ